MRVTLAFPYNTRGGRPYRAGTTITIDDAEGHRLIHAGLARKATEQVGPEVEEPPTTAAEPSTQEEG